MRYSSVSSSAVEGLEDRRLFCALHTGEATDALAPTSTQIQAALAAAAKKTSVVSDHKGSWYKPARTIRIRTTGATADSVGNVAVRRAVSGATPSVVSVASFPVNAAGLPLLTSRADGLGLKVFLDFDGYNSDIPFDMSVSQGGDGNGATFNAKEQTVIYNAWRDIVSYYSMFDVNVTTVQPATGGTNPSFVWQRITDSVSGGAAYVGAINNTQSNGWTDDSNAISRTSGIAHEIGHQLNLQHQSDWYDDATKKNEYTNGYLAHGSIIGIDYGQDVHKWWYGRNSTSANTFQDDLQRSATYLKSKYAASIDGFMPDDFTGTTFASSTALASASGAFGITGTIERVADADVFSFASTGGVFNVGVYPYYRSAIAPKFELYDASGNLIAAKDDTSLRGLGDNTNEEVKLDLTAGTYYVKVLGHGDYGDVGEYNVIATPLPGEWDTRDVLGPTNGMDFPGSVTYNAANSVFTQTAGGSGIYSGADAYRYTYVTLTGNGSITAKVESLATDAVTTAPRAGLVLRESLSGTGRMAYIDYSPTSTLYGVRATVGGGPTLGTNAALGVGNWLRITRTGNNYVLATSVDGNSWTTVYNNSLSSLTSQIYLGLSTFSRDDIHATTAVFSNVSYTGTLVAPLTTSNSAAAPANLVSTPAAGQSTAMNLSWTDTNGAETGYAVERSVDGVNWSKIATLPADTSTYTDTQTFGSMRWWYRVAAIDDGVSGLYSNVTSVINKPAAVTNWQSVDVSNTALSLTWRDVSGDTGYRVERSADGGATYTVLGTTAANITGYNVTGLAINTSYTFRITPTSAVGDGVPFVKTETTLLPATVVSFTNKAIGNVGLSWTAVTGATGYRVDRSTDRTTWTSVGTTPGVTTFTDTTAAALTHYYYRVVGTTSLTQGAYSNVVFFATPAATELPAGWTDADLGSVGGSGAGTINVAAKTATVIGSGSSSFTATSDQTNYLYTQLTGDGQIVARVATLEALNDNARAGIMIRNTLATNSAFAAAYYQSTSGTLGTQMNYRATAGASGVSVGSTTDTTYRWVKLVRAGNLFTAYRSATGVDGSWVTIGSTTIAMNATVYVGLVASSRDNAYLDKATFDNVTYTPSVAPAVSSMLVNGGAVQRSMVNTVALNFSLPVALGSSALTLLKKQTDGSYIASAEPYTVSPTPGATTYASTYTLTFGGTGGSVADGSYRLSLTPAAITTANGGVMATAASLDFHRFFGDTDGDRGVSINDFNAMATAFGSTLGSAAYNATLDYDGDNGISINDFNAFSIRFGVSI